MHNKATDKKPDVSELRADRSDVMVEVAEARACPAPSLLSLPMQPGDALFSGTHTNKTYFKSPAAACQIVCHRSTFSKVMTHHRSKSPLCVSPGPDKEGQKPSMRIGFLHTRVTLTPLCPLR